MRNLYKKMPESPGVYVFKDEKGRPLYVGKAGNLRRRAASYFMRAQDSRIEALVSKIKKIDYKKTDSALEALILEAELIKKYAPPYNVKEKDDKSFLYVEISRDEFPRVLLVRGKSRIEGKRFGPFASASNIREALKIFRKIFPWSTHEPSKLGKFARPCFDYEIDLCPGTCVGVISRSGYVKNIKRLTLFLEGKKSELIKQLEKEMKASSRNLEYEKAGKLKRQLFALRHIQDTALISGEESLNSSAEGGSALGGKSYALNSRYRIEGYDVSNISGASAVGSMVVFSGDKPDKSQYRKFRIQSLSEPNDVGMLQEMLTRRFRHPEWPLPDLMLVDGGRGQVNAARAVLAEFGFKIHVVGIAKGPKRKKNEFVGAIPAGVSKTTLIGVRNEAHRFAISYHRSLRGRGFIGRPA